MSQALQIEESIVHEHSNVHLKITAPGRMKLASTPLFNTLKNLTYGEIWVFYHS